MLAVLMKLSARGQSIQNGPQLDELSGTYIETDPNFRMADDYPPSEESIPGF
jgi:hypothetical protein